MPPVNDDLADAIVISASGTTDGTTVDSTVETGQEEDDGYVNTVWYRVEVPATGDFVWTLTAEGFESYMEIYAAVGSQNVTPMGSDPPADFADLVQGYDNYFDSIYGGNPSTTIAAVAGDVFYILATSNSFSEGDTGTFSFSIVFPIPSTCFDAADVIYGPSSTASVSGSSVEETQTYDSVFVEPNESLSDLVPTLRLEPADLAALPGIGYYHVRVVTHSASPDAFNWCVMIKRNDVTLLSGYNLDTVTGGTPSSTPEYITVPPAPASGNEFTMVFRCPIDPGNDTIDIVFAKFDDPGVSITIDEVCFQLGESASPGPAFDLLDVPQYPLGTSAGDMGTTDQQGDLVAYKDDSPTFNRHEVWGSDMCVTDDGKIYVIAGYIRGRQGGTSYYTGPILQVWDPSSPGWTVLEDDIAGLGVKRSASLGVQGIGMDTDGTDLWFCFHEEDDNGGAGIDLPGDGYSPYVPLHVTKRWVLHAWKYEPGSGLTDLGVLHAPSDEKWQVIDTRFGSTSPHVKIAPNGDVWVAFIQWQDTAFGGAMPSSAYAAKWDSGTTWDVYRQPPPDFYPAGIPLDGDDAGFTTYDAQTYISGSGTVASVTQDGEAAVSETQDTYANDTLTGIVPPAGDWAVAILLEPAIRTGTPAGTYGFKFYKNGSPLGAASDDGGATSSFTTPVWGWWAGHGWPSSAYGSFNGTTDTLELRMRATGNCGPVYVTKLMLIPIDLAVCNAANQWGAQDCAFVEDGQFHALLTFVTPGGVAGANEPGLITMFATVDPENTDGNPIVEGDSLSGIADRWQMIQYAEFDGSDFQKVWETIVEDELPDQCTPTNTSFFGMGHTQEGFGIADDGSDAYVMANLMKRTSIPDTMIIAKIIATGLEAVGSLPAGLIGAYGADNAISSSGGAGQWSWQTHARSLVIDDRGNIWFGMQAEGIFSQLAITLGQRVETGTGGWLNAALVNNEMGEDAGNGPSPILAMSPDQSIVYVLGDPFIYDDGAVNPNTWGVWACDVLEDVKIPLIVAGLPQVYRRTMGG